MYVWMYVCVRSVWIYGYVENMWAIYVYIVSCSYIYHIIPDHIISYHIISYHITSYTWIWIRTHIQYVTRLIKST